jgi:hypothetical protein
MRLLSLSKYPGTGGGGAGVTSFNTRTGIVTLLGSDVITALGYTPLSGANDGLSLSGTIAQLGQLVGAVGGPAKLLDNREIPFNGFSLLFNGIGAVTGAHLILEYDPAAAGLFEPYISFLASNGTTNSTLRIDSTGGIYFGLNNGPFCTGRDNFSLGSNAMANATTARDSIAIGPQTLFNAGTSQKNIAIGSDSLDTSGSSIGSSNTVIGSISLDNGSSVGNANIVIGSANNNSGGGAIADDNIIIGNSNNLENGVTNTIVIGDNNVSVPVSNIILLGVATQNTIIGNDQAVIPVDNGSRVQVFGDIQNTGSKLAIRTIVANDNILTLDNTIVVDTTSGNISLGAIPANLKNGVFTIKKKTIDANTVTVTMSTGDIYSSAGPSTSFVFSNPGESITLHFDGTNAFII